MKKFIFCAILTCAAMQFVCAQKQYVGVQLGFTQPITRLNMPVAGKEKTLTPTTLNGFKVGVVYDATIAAGFGYSLGLNYTFGANKTDWQKVGNFEHPRFILPLSHTSWRFLLIGNTSLGLPRTHGLCFIPVLLCNVV